MNTALSRRLTPDQYDKLISAACERRKLVIAEQECQEWYLRRERYERVAAGCLDFRKSHNGVCLTIFDKINETLGIVQGVRRFLLARVCKDLFGSAPFFYVKPEGPADAALALKLQKHVDWKLRLADYRNKIKEAVGIALDLGECPVKTTWDRRIDLSERLATLLTDKATGQPVLTADGDTIEDCDETSGGGPALDAFGMPVLSQDGIPLQTPVSFLKAPEIVLDATRHEWSEHFVEEQSVIYEGLNISACHWKDVNWPMNAPSLADADFVSHTFDCRWSKLREKYAPGSFTNGMPAEAAQTGEEDEERVEGSASDKSDKSEPSDPSDPTPDDSDTLAILHEIRDGSRSPKSHERLPLLGEAEALGGEDDDPIIKVCEVSYDYDCFEDGIPRRLWLVLLPDYEKCLFLDFRANISPRAAKPIHLVTVNQVKHRAYGKGLHETYEKMANMADQLLCSILYRNKINSDPVKIWNPDRTKEGKANPTLIIEPGRTYSIDGSQWGPKDILETVSIPDLDSRTWQLMELFMQLVQVDSGVTNANQGDMSDLPSNSTATGVNSMLESSSVLHQYVLDEIRDSLTPHLGYAIELIYKMQDRDETFDYLEGNDPAPGGEGGSQEECAVVSQVMALSDARRLKNLPMNVEFLLTRTKRQEQRDAAMAAIPMGVQYGQLPPQDQARMNDAFVQLFRALGFDDPERFFPKPLARPESGDRRPESPESPAALPQSGTGILPVTASPVTGRMPVPLQAAAPPAA